MLVKIAMALILAMALALVPAVSATYLVVGLNVSSQAVRVSDLSLAFSGSLLSPGRFGKNATVEVVDSGWRTVSRARVTASTALAGRTSAGSTITTALPGSQATALVPVSKDAYFLVARSDSGTGQIIDLRAASCGSHPLCPNCARAFPQWCVQADRRANQQGPVDRGVLFGVLLDLVVIATIAVLFMARRHNK